MDNLQTQKNANDMSDETKNTVTAPDGAEQQNGQQPETAESKATKAKSESKPKAKTKSETESDTSALRAVGVEACKRHQLAQAWVTSDGQVFPQEGDAREHARNLGDKTTLKVTAE